MMRFAGTLLSVLVLSALAQGAAADEVHRHTLKLPVSYLTIIKTQYKSLFTVAQPLLATTTKSSDEPVAVRDTPAVATVLKGDHQGFYPVSKASSEGLNFTGMARQLPDLTRNFANNTAGLMSWTTKFN